MTHRDQHIRNQPTLFGEASDVIQRESQKPVARASDPVTSHDGAEWIAPELTEIQSRMCFAFQLSRTANEAALECVSLFGGNHETYRKRKGELEAMGIIEFVEKRRCKVTNRTAEAWRVTR